MKYQTRNEFEHFVYSDGQIGSVEITSGFFHLWMDNIGILPECSANRDIRQMRCNSMLFRIENMKLEAFVLEGYRYYDANGKLLREDPDREVAPEEYEASLKSLAEGYMVSLEKTPAEDGRFIYTLVADSSEDSTFCITISGTADVEEWDRFLSPAGSF